MEVSYNFCGIALYYRKTYRIKYSNVAKVCGFAMNYSCSHSTVRLEKLFPFCYRCTFLKQCDRLRSVPFYYRSPFRFFCCLRLNDAVSPPFLGTCNRYVRTTSIDVTPTRLTLAVGSLVSVGSLVLQCLMAYSDYTNYYHRQGLKPGDIS